MRLTYEKINTLFSNKEYLHPCIHCGKTVILAWGLTNSQNIYSESSWVIFHDKKDECSLPGVMVALSKWEVLAMWISSTTTLCITKIYEQSKIDKKDDVALEKIKCLFQFMSFLYNEPKPPKQKES